MATEDNFIVAIELGSSKVTGVAGRKQPDGAIEVLAFAQEPSTTFIRKGRINNVSKMTQCVANMKEKLEKQMQKSISRVYVGIGGMGMHTVANTVIRHFDAKMEVTQEMVDSISDENRATSNPDRDILEAVPQEYRLGTQLQTDPVGILTETIEGHYLNIVASSSVREELRNCFRTAGVAIADMPITVQALADAMLTEPERRSGCVFVDMGSETTSVAVYKNNLLRHLAVIPLGGANVNRDISSLQIEDEEAESLKLKHGSAMPDLNASERRTITLSDGRNIQYEEFCGLVEARVEEIILNINNQIKLSHYEKNQLLGGLIITGGASYMKDIDKAFTRHTGFEKIRFVRNIRLSLRSKSFGEINANGSCNAALALIDKGDINCCGGELGAVTIDLFGGDEKATNPAEEEQKAPTPEEIEAQKLAEEEARKLAEEEEQRRLEAEERERKEQERQKRKGSWKNFMTKAKNFMGSLVSEDDSNYNTGK